MPTTAPTRATAKQLAYLDSLGVSVPAGFTKQQASDLIARKLRERERQQRIERGAQPATAKQLAALDRLGAGDGPDPTRTEASRLIDRKLVERAEQRPGRSDEAWGPRRLGRRRGRRRGWKGYMK